MKLFLAIIIFALSARAFAQENDFNLIERQSILMRQIETPVGSPVQLPIKKFDPSIFQTNSWINAFVLVIVVNKANTGATKQTMVIYKNGKLAYTTKVSTGREQFEAKRKHPWEHAPAVDYFSSTNTGYFVPIYTELLHKSQLWNATMPFAIFFDGGIAIHQAPRGTEGQLGTRASGGCVRVSPQAARAIFYEVNLAGQGTIPMLTQSGSPILKPNGDVRMREGYKTLVIVEDIVEDTVE